MNFKPDETLDFYCFLHAYELSSDTIIAGFNWLKIQFGMHHKTFLGKCEENEWLKSVYWSIFEQIQWANNEVLKTSMNLTGKD